MFTISWRKQFGLLFFVALMGFTMVIAMLPAPKASAATNNVPNSYYTRLNNATVKYVPASGAPVYYYSDPGYYLRGGGALITQNITSEFKAVNRQLDTNDYCSDSLKTGDPAWTRTYQDGKQAGAGVCKPNVSEPATVDNSIADAKYHALYTNAAGAFEPIDAATNSTFTSFVKTATWLKSPHTVGGNVLYVQDKTSSANNCPSFFMTRTSDAGVNELWFFAPVNVQTQAQETSSVEYQKAAAAVGHDATAILACSASKASNESGGESRIYNTMATLVGGDATSWQDATHTDQGGNTGIGTGENDIDNECGNGGFDCMYGANVGRTGAFVGGAFAGELRETLRGMILAGTPAAGAVGGAPGTTPADADNCAQLGESSLRWILCPVYDMLAGFADGVIGILQDLLSYSTKYMNGPMEDAWRTFRGFGLALLLIAALVMVVSQALGFSFLDAYMIKKTLPRLLIAIIGITLSWEIMKFVVTFFDSIGHLLYGLITGPFNAVVQPGAGPEDGVAGAVTNTIGSGFVVSATVVGAAAFLGIGGIISMMATVAIALLIGLAVLGIRTAVISLCIIIAPLAIAAYILPGTKKMWDFWQNTFLTTLLMFPIVMAFLAVGDAMSSVIGSVNDANGWLAMIVRFAPFFLLPFAFKLAGGLMKTIFSITDDKQRGVFDRLKKGRQARVAQNIASMKAGSRFNDRNGFTRAFNRGTANAATGISGRFGIGQRGDAARGFNTIDQAAALDKSPVAQAFKEDDDGMHALVRLNSGMSETQAKSSLASRYMANGKSAADASRMASEAVNRARATGMKGRASAVWAAKQLAITGTGYADAADMVNTSAIASGGSSALAADIGGFNNAIAKQKGRNDQAFGSGDVIGAIQKQANAMASGTATPPAISYDNMQAAISTVGTYQWGSLKGGAFKNFAKHVESGLTANAGDSDGKGGVLSSQQATERRQNSAIQMLEMQKAVLNGSSGENQSHINELLLNQGIDFNVIGTGATPQDVAKNSLEEQIIRVASQGMKTPVITQADLNGRARVYDQGNVDAQNRIANAGP